MKLKSRKNIFGVLLLASGLASVFFMNSCTRRANSIEAFAKNQERKITENSIYNQADFNFWAALYEPTMKDLEDLKIAWNEHSRAFPKSRAMAQVEEALRESGVRVAIVALYTSDADKADLNNKTLGWSIHPIPESSKELLESDQVLRAFFPVKNMWARYFLLRYRATTWMDAPAVTVGRPDARLELPKIHGQSGD